MSEQCDGTLKDVDNFYNTTNDIVCTLSCPCTAGMLNPPNFVDPDDYKDTDRTIWTGKNENF